VSPDGTAHFLSANTLPTKKTSRKERKERVSKHIGLFEQHLMNAERIISNLAALPSGEGNGSGAEIRVDPLPDPEN
jgi:hypothetical protein